MTCMTCDGVGVWYFKRVGPVSCGTCQGEGTIPDESSDSYEPIADDLAALWQDVGENGGA